MANNQYINKVVYGGNTLIDISTDDVKASDVLSGIKFHLPSGASGTGTCTYDADTSDATAVAAEILLGKTAYKNGAKLTGTMPNNGGTNVVVSTVAGTSIPQGYSDGSAKAVIDSASIAALIAANVRENITILGVTGTMSGSEDIHAQAKTVTPSTSQQIITPDSPTYNYLSQVTVAAIPYTETDNAAGGKTVTIAAAS
jgi:hypothetical protein